ncbi:ABC transporter ATP-binding protein [Nitratireductor aestuarii]|uniref:ABC transporter ATP-binding protein n=1 Tax=Nitratireductor aestuarii TaxID=1735103 RepID=A0A916RS00_9HYPH|nr:ABC transporter ATP-binding protein [Nitratireductor aestuarii]GGA66167.1 ABC transporter ATP-binding protein [Nitratireductor aestuarii]
MTALLDISGLKVDVPGRAGTLHAIRGIDLSIGAGECFTIVGESGCGKSLTAMSVLGLLPRAAILSAERMSWKGQDMRRFSRRQWANLHGPEIAAIFQEPMTALNPVLTVGEQIIESFVHHRLGNRKAALARAGELLERVGVVPVERRLAQYPHEMSGGLRQRVMIAMALMCQPKLMIADEPTTALDVTTQVEILKLLKELQAEMGMALLLITHDLGVVAHMADRVAVMYAGQIVETGSVASVLTRSAHPYTSALLDCLPTRDQPLTPIPGVVPALFGELEGCMFRNRCRFAREACADPVPARSVGEGHVYRCLLEANEVAA